MIEWLKVSVVDNLDEYNLDDITSTESDMMTSFRAGSYHERVASNHDSKIDP